MPRHARQLAGSRIYHVMLRGVNRDAIFVEDEDYEHFLHALARTCEISGCVVLAYCLMTNHVHLVLRTIDEPIGLVMKRLGVRYAGWFNRKYERVGHVFQDRFKSVPVETDAQLVTLVRYTWDNPVKAGMVARAEAYRWSSRRFLDGGSALVDVAALRSLVPPDALSADSVDSRVVEVPDLTPARMGRPRRYTDEGVLRMLRQICSIASTEEFSALDRFIQQRVIRSLRTRSVPYDQIARATGLSSSSVRRLHITGRGAGSVEVA